MNSLAKPSAEATVILGGNIPQERPVPSCGQSFVSGSHALPAPQRVTPSFADSATEEIEKVLKIQNALCMRHGITMRQLLGKTRTADLVIVRHIAMFLARELTTLSLHVIGRLFQRDHGTIIHACNNIKSLRSISAKLDAQVKEWVQAIGKVPPAPLPTPEECLLARKELSAREARYFPLTIEVHPPEVTCAPAPCNCALVKLLVLKGIISQVEMHSLTQLKLTV